MAKFLDTTGISYHLEQLIKNANEKLILISPYLKINDRIKELLEDKDRLKIDVRVIYGKNELQPEENNWLRSINSIRTSFCKNLHAKCYCNESEALITSMNLYEFSQSNNNEMGIFIQRNDDQELFEKIYEEVSRLIRISEEITVSIEKVSQNYHSNSNVKNNNHSDSHYGHCIRCGNNIQLNPQTPYCRDCFNVWRRFEDVEYKERFCHICGEAHSTSMIKPTCYSCYKKNKNKLEFFL